MFFTEEKLKSMLFKNPQGMSGDDAITALFALSSVKPDSISGGEYNDFCIDWMESAARILNYFESFTNEIVLIGIANLVKLSLTLYTQTPSGELNDEVLFYRELDGDIEYNPPRKNYNVSFNTPDFSALKLVYYARKLLRSGCFEAKNVVDWGFYLLASEFDLPEDFLKRHDIKLKPSKIDWNDNRRILEDCSKEVRKLKTFGEKSADFLIARFVYNHISNSHRVMENFINSPNFFNKVIDKSSNFNDVIHCACYCTGRKINNVSNLKMASAPAIVIIGLLSGFNLTFDSIKNDANMIPTLIAISPWSKEAEKKLDKYLACYSNKYKALLPLVNVPRSAPTDEATLIDYANHLDHVSLIKILHEKQELLDKISDKHSAKTIIQAYLSPPEPDESISVVNAFALLAHRGCGSVQILRDAFTIVTENSEEQFFSFIEMSKGRDYNDVEIKDLIIRLIHQKKFLANVCGLLCADKAETEEDRKIICKLSLFSLSLPVSRSIAGKYIDEKMLYEVWEESLKTSLQSFQKFLMYALKMKKSLGNKSITFNRVVQILIDSNNYTDFLKFIKMIGIHLLKEIPIESIIKSLDYLIQNDTENAIRLIKDMNSLKMSLDFAYKELAINCQEHSDNVLLIFQAIPKQSQCAAAILNNLKLRGHIKFSAFQFVKEVLELFPKVPVKEEESFFKEPSPKWNEDKAVAKKKSIWDYPTEEEIKSMKCTYLTTGENYMVQPYFRCYTCGLVGSRGCCVPCAFSCHRGHDLEYCPPGSFFCDCFSSGRCKQNPDSVPIEEEEEDIQNQEPFMDGQPFQLHGLNLRDLEGIPLRDRMEIERQIIGNRRRRIGNADGVPKISTFGAIHNGRPRPNPFGGNDNGRPRPNPFGGNDNGRPRPNPFEGNDNGRPHPNPFGGIHNGRPHPNQFGGPPNGRPRNFMGYAPPPPTGFGRARHFEPGPLFRFGLDRFNRNTTQQDPVSDEALFNLIKTMKNVQLQEEGETKNSLSVDIMDLDIFKLKQENINHNLHIITPEHPIVLGNNNQFFGRRPPTGFGGYRISGGFGGGFGSPGLKKFGKMNTFASVLDGQYTVIGDGSKLLLVKEDKEIASYMCHSNIIGVVSSPIDQTLVAVSLPREVLIISVLEEKFSVENTVQLMNDDPLSMVISVDWVPLMPCIIAVTMPKYVKLYNIPEDCISPMICFQVREDKTVFSSTFVIEEDEPAAIISLSNDKLIKIPITSDLSGPINIKTNNAQDFPVSKLSYSLESNIVFASSDNTISIFRPCDITKVQKVKLDDFHFGSFCCVIPDMPNVFLMRDDSSILTLEFTDSKLLVSYIREKCSGLSSEENKVRLALTTNEVSYLGKNVEQSLGAPKFVEEEKSNFSQEIKNEDIKKIDVPPTFWTNSSTDIKCIVSCGGKQILDNNMPFPFLRQQTITVKPVESDVVIVGLQFKFNLMGTVPIMINGKRIVEVEISDDRCNSIALAKDECKLSGVTLTNMGRILEVESVLAFTQKAEDIGIEEESTGCSSLGKTIKSVNVSPGKTPQSTIAEMAADLLPNGVKVPPEVFEQSFVEKEMIPAIQKCAQKAEIADDEWRSIENKSLEEICEKGEEIPESLWHNVAISNTQSSGDVAPCVWKESKKPMHAMFVAFTTKN